MVWLKEVRFSPLSLAGLVSFLPEKRDGWSDRFSDVNSIYVTLWNTEVGMSFRGRSAGSFTEQQLVIEPTELQLQCNGMPFFFCLILFSYEE